MININEQFTISPYIGFDNNTLRINLLTDTRITNKLIRYNLFYRYGTPTAFIITDIHGIDRNNLRQQIKEYFISTIKNNRDLNGTFNLLIDTELEVLWPDELSIFEYKFVDIHRISVYDDNIPEYKFVVELTGKTTSELILPIELIALDSNSTTDYQAILNVAVYSKGVTYSNGTVIIPDGVEAFTITVDLYEEVKLSIKTKYVYVGAVPYVPTLDRFYINGQYTQVNGETVSGIVKLMSDGSIDPGFDYSSNGTIYSDPYYRNGELLGVDSSFNLYLNNYAGYLIKINRVGQTVATFFRNTHDLNLYKGKVFNMLNPPSNNVVLTVHDYD